MKLLLDTHVLVWSVLEPERLNNHVVSKLKNKDSEIWISPISIWEIMILEQKRRLILEPDGETWIRKVFETLHFREAKLNHEIAIQSCQIQLPHQDPADRFLAATAKVYDLTLVTADKRISRCREVKVLKN